MNNFDFISRCGERRREKLNGIVIKKITAAAHSIIIKRAWKEFTSGKRNNR